MSTDEAGDFPLFHNQLINREAAERGRSRAGRVTPASATCLTHCGPAARACDLLTAARWHAWPIPAGKLSREARVSFLDACVQSGAGRRCRQAVRIARTSKHSAAVHALSEMPC